MKIEIKKSWFEANWNKPNRMKRHVKRYNKKSRNVSLILSNAKQYKLTMPEDYRNLVIKQVGLYDQQKYRLESMINAFFNGNITEENKSTIIDEIFKGKRYWAEWKDDKGKRFISPTPPKSFFKKIKEKIFG